MSHIHKDYFHISDGNILYVSVNGDDSLAEIGNSERPWRTPWSAASQMMDGDTMYICSGTYSIGGVGSGEDLELADPFTSVDVNLAHFANNLNFHFENGVTIHATASIPSGGANYGVALFMDNNLNKTINITGDLIYQTESQVFSLVWQESSVSNINVEMLGVISNVTTGGIAPFWLEGNVIIDVGYIRGTDARMLKFSLADTSIKDIKIGQFISTQTQLIYGIIRYGNGEGGLPTLYPTQSGKVIIDINTIELDCTVAAAEPVLYGVFGSETFSAALWTNGQVNINIQNYRDNYVPAGAPPAQTSFSLFEAIEHVSMEQSVLNVNVENLITGYVVCQWNNASVKTHTESQCFLNFKNVVCNEHGFLFFGQDVTLVDSSITFSVENLYNLSTDATIKLRAPGPTTSPVNSVLQFRGRYLQDQANAIIDITDNSYSGVVYVRDTVMINDGTVDAIESSVAVNVVVQNAATNSLTVDSDVTEVGQSIIRSTSYI